MNVQRSGISSQKGLDYHIHSLDNLERKRLNCYAILAISDLISLAVSMLLANALYIGDMLASHGLTMLSVLAPLYAWAASLDGSYSGQVLKDPRIGVSKSVRALILSTAAMLIIAYTFKVGDIFSRGVFWSGTALSILLLTATRLIMGRLLLKGMGGTPFSTVVIVHDVEWNRAPHDIVLDATTLGFDPATDDPLQFHALAKVVAHADRVLVACRDEHAATWAHVLKSMAVDGEIIAPDVDRIGVIGISHHAGHRTLVVSAGPLHLRDRTVKRAFDIVMAGLGLVILSPVLLIVALAIRLESPGPVLFRQQRIGRDNTLFMMFKFRSMYHSMSDASAKVLTARSDSRVTRVGNFIRRNSLDELPQLLNVFRGEMSMVGPRPHALSARAADLLYWEIDHRYRHRHAVKPGVTGLAQVRGFRGATVSTTDLTNRLASDLEYVRNWSMRNDIWILFRTIFVIRHANAF